MTIPPLPQPSGHAALALVRAELARVLLRALAPSGSGETMRPASPIARSADTVTVSQKARELAMRPAALLDDTGSSTERTSTATRRGASAAYAELRAERASVDASAETAPSPSREPALALHTQAHAPSAELARQLASFHAPRAIEGTRAGATGRRATHPGSTSEDERPPKRRWRIDRRRLALVVALVVLLGWLLL